MRILFLVAALAPPPAPSGTSEDENDRFPTSFRLSARDVERVEFAAGAPEA